MTENKEQTGINRQDKGRFQGQSFRGAEHPYFVSTVIRLVTLDSTLLSLIKVTGTWTTKCNSSSVNYLQMAISNISGCMPF